MNPSIKSAINKASADLLQAGVPDPRREARSLIAHLLRQGQTYLLAHNDDVLSTSEVKALDKLIARRRRGEPLQYITGHQEFYKLDFEVTPEVLIPRPETEAIVEVALGLLRNEGRPIIADVGTGSGCIAVSLLKERPDAIAVGTDTSAAALRVAEHNARCHGVEDRLTLIESDLFEKLPPETKFSVVLSNPPYVPEADWNGLAREVRDFEPRSALVAGVDGLDCIRRLLRDSPLFLRREGHLVFEIGFGQDDAVKSLVDLNLWDVIEIRKDLQGIPRTMILRKRQKPAC
jgi:release factor glutamine methyltransferase